MVAGPGCEIAAAAVVSDDASCHLAAVELACLSSVLMNSAAAAHPAAGEQFFVVPSVPR